MTVTPIAGLGAFTYAANLSFLDADVASGNIPHGLGVIPLEVMLTPTGYGATICALTVTTIDITNIVVTKSSGAANTACTARLIVSAPHSIGR